MLADVVRTDSHQLRPVASDSAEAEAVSRMRKTLIWARTRAARRPTSRTRPPTYGR